MLHISRYLVKGMQHAWVRTLAVQVLAAFLYFVLCTPNSVTHSLLPSHPSLQSPPKSQTAPNYGLIFNHCCYTGM